MFLAPPSKRSSWSRFSSSTLGQDMVRLAVEEFGGLRRLRAGGHDDGAAGDVGLGDLALAVALSPFGDGHLELADMAADFGHFAVEINGDVPVILRPVQ